MQNKRLMDNLKKHGIILEHGQNTIPVFDLDGNIIPGRKNVIDWFDDEVEPSRTQQQFKDECDVNKILEKYELEDVIRARGRSPGFYSDLTQAKNFQEMHDSVIKAQNAFDELPAKTRKYFNHDPQELIDFLNDKNNLDEAIRLGLVDKPQASIQTPTASAGLADSASQSVTKTQKSKNQIQNNNSNDE